MLSLLTFTLTLLLGCTATPAPQVSAPPGEAEVLTRECHKSGASTFDVYFVDLDESRVDILHNTIDGRPNPISLQHAQDTAAARSERLLFATNGGMYLPDYAAQGLLVKGGKEVYPLNLRERLKPWTNFYNIPPNGVFYLRKDGGFGIDPRHEVPPVGELSLATQSGPMLVIDGQVNTELTPTANSTKLRSGVGVKGRNAIKGKYEMVFVISNGPINFHCFARVFLYYGCTDALYLDGVISEAYFDPAFAECPQPPANQYFSSVLTVTAR